MKGRHCDYATTCTTSLPYVYIRGEPHFSYTSTCVYGSAGDFICTRRCSPVLGGCWQLYLYQQRSWFGCDAERTKSRNANTVKGFDN